MGNCEITINTEKIKLKGQGNNPSFSEEGFDTWLWENRVEIARQVKSPNGKSATLMVEVDPIEERKAKWDGFNRKMKDIHLTINQDATRVLGKGFEKLIKIGTTTLFKYVGKASDITKPVNDFGEKTQSEWVAEQISKGKTQAEALKSWKAKERLDTLRQIDGNIFGALVEDALTGTTRNIDDLRSHSGLKANLDKVGMTFDQALERMKSVSEQAVKAIKKMIFDKHGSSAKIFTEVEVFSKAMSQDMQAAVRTAMLRNGKTVPNAVQGYLDVVVQDANGELHTYDIKLASMTITQWWSSDTGNWKYDDVSAQQMAYATMARQWGIDFNSINIIPAYIQYDSDGNIKSVTEQEFKTFSLTNPYAIACERYFPVHRNTDSKTIKNLSKLMDELYPGLQLDTAVKTMEMTKDFVMKNIIRGRKSDGKYHLPLDEDEHSLLGKEIVFDTKEAAEKYVEEEYIPRMNQKFAQELRAFGKELQSIARSKAGEKSKIERLYEMAKGISKNKDTQDWIVNKFKKFAIQPGWDLVSDEENLLADYGIFIFVNNGLAEVIMMDKSDLYGIVEIGKAKNTTVLGNLRHDLANGMDDIVTLKSLRGNLMLMKAMAFISQNEGGLFNGIKVQAVRAMNLRWRQEVDEPTGKLLDNWNTLVGLYNIKCSGDDSKTILRTLNEKVMLPTALAYVQRANDIAETFLEKQVNFKEHKHFMETFTDDSAEDILRYIRNLQSGSNVRVENSANWSTYSPEFEAYQLLLRAYMAVRGFMISAQNGVGDFVSGGYFLTGSRSSSPAESNSAALRVFNQIDTVYEQRLREEFSRIVRPWQNQMLKVLEENDVDKVWGGNEREFFKMCFEQDENGDITSDFCLIPPDDPKHPYFAGGQHPELKKLVRMFLETINEIRIPDPDERERLSAIPRSIYYQVPLTEASFIQQWKQGGFLEASKAKVQSIFDQMKNFAFGKPMSNWEIKEFKSIDKEQVYDPYLNISQDAQDFRRQLLSGEEFIVDDDGRKSKKSFGVNKFELSLDTIFLKAMASALRARVSQDFMPLFTGLRAILAYNQNIEGAELDKVIRAVDDYIKSAVFGKSIIEPEYRKIYDLIKILRHATSITALAFNSVAFFRENIASTLRTSFNKHFDPLMKGQFTTEEYMSCMEDIIAHSAENIDVLSFYSQINFAYGLVNVSQEQLAEASKTGRFNPNNWAEDLLFMTSTSPDFLHRNAILCAILKHRGSFEAYSLNEDKELVYDMAKDKFYSVFWTYYGRYSEIPDKETRLKYKEQEGYYINALNEWNQKYGLNLKIGDKLPHALSPSEANGIRVYADHMFGNYDPNTKSLLQKGMLGSLIFQFKTYSLGRFLQSFRDKGTINVTRQRIMQTTDGEDVYKVIILPSDVANFNKYGAFIYKRKSELTDEELTRAIPVIIMAGSPTGGKFITTLEFTRDFLFNRENFLENWKSNDVYKANLYISLLDNFAMLIIAMLLKLMYGQETVDDIYNQDWWTRWSYTVLMGVAQDGPIDQVVGGLVGNGTPPSFAIIKSFYQNAYRVITGEDSAMYGFLNSFGATRQFAGMFNNAR